MMEIELRKHNIYVKPVFLHGAETWVPPIEEGNKRTLRNRTIRGSDTVSKDNIYIHRPINNTTTLAAWKNLYSQ
jgi:hypothetical protein